MRKITQAKDVNGNPVKRNDMVVTIGDHVSAKIADLCRENDMDFLLLKSQHQSYNRGVWHPADQVLRISVAKTKQTA